MGNQALCWTIAPRNNSSASTTFLDSMPGYRWLIMVDFLTANIKQRWFVVMLGLGACVLSGRADTHIFGGALSTNQDGKCYFSNGALFDANQSSYSFPQVLRTNGLNTGYFRGDVLTFTALAGTT